MSVSEPSVPLAYGLEPRLANALTDPLRTLILEELHRRPLSPSKFVRERGGDLSQVSRAFRYLRACGYAEVVEERARSARGPLVEHVYGLAESGGMPASLQALPEIAIDPHVSPALGSYWSRIVGAVAAGTFDGRIETHSSWDTVVLDREACAWLRQRLDEVIASSTGRTRSSGADEGRSENSIPITIGFTVLRSPQPATEIVHRFRRLPEASPGPFQLGPQVANALANRWRAKILTELFSRPLSPSQFVERFGGDPSYIARCFRELSGWGLIELIEEKGGGRNGGGVERIFRNAQHCYFDLEVWATVPPFLRSAVSRGWTAVLGERLAEVLKSGISPEGGAFRAKWREAVVDAEGWRKLNQELDAILDHLPHLQAESLNRTAGDLTKLMPTLISMACFESPPP